MSKGRLQDKVAIVTGSTQGIGEAVAMGYAREGAKVIVCGRGVEKGQRVTKAITDAGGIAHFIQFDLCDEQSVVNLVQKTIEHFGDLHIVVHNAHPTEHTGGGSSFDAKVDNFIGELSTEAWRKVTLPTFDGMFWVLREAIRAFKKRGGGTIINVSSLVSLEGLVGVDIHTATKGAMNSLTRSIAVEYGSSNIRCNTIVVGLVATAALRTLMEDPITGPQLAKCVLTKRIGEPRDFVGPAIFLASEEEAFFVTGQCICVDGGMGIKMPMPAVLTGGGG